MTESNIHITLQEIGEVVGATAINRRALRRLTHETVSVDMTVKVVPDMARSTLSVLVSCSYRAIIGLIRERLFVSTAFAKFEVENLAACIDKYGHEKLLPTDLMLNMLGITVGALRGIVSVRLSDTALRNRPLPIIDLHSLLNRLSL